MNPTLFSLLSCPKCASPFLPISPEGKVLVCGSCGTEFPLRNGIADFTSIPGREAPQWGHWEDHLQGFAERRDRRVRKPNPGKLKRWQRKETAFLDFIDPAPGRILDVGCGPGSLRKGLPPPRYCYTGIDPLPPNVQPDFDFVCGLAESLPFRDGVFSALMVRSALDHFCEPLRFFEEARRVLMPGGRLYIEQAVHECRGPLSACRRAAHVVQDWIDRLRQKTPADKHMNDFTRDQVIALVPEGLFRIVATRLYMADSLAAPQCFIALEVLP